MALHLRTTGLTGVCALLVLAGMPGCDRQEHQELLATLASQRDAIELTSALEQSDIPGVRLERIEGGVGPATYSIHCPAAAAPYARIAMTQLGLPREPSAARSADGTSLFPTRADDVARDLARRGEELEDAIALLEHVATAHVQVASPALEDPLSRTAANPSVLVVVRTVEPLEPGREQLLRERVTRACAAAFAGFDVQRTLTLLIEGRQGALASSEAKAAIAAAKAADPGLTTTQVELSILSRYVVPLAAIAAMGVLVALAMRDRWRSMLAR